MYKSLIKTSKNPGIQEIKRKRGRKVSDEKNLGKREGKEKKGMKREE